MTKATIALHVANIPNYILDGLVIDKKQKPATGGSPRLGVPILNRIWFWRAARNVTFSSLEDFSYFLVCTNTIGWGQARVFREHGRDYV